MKIRNFVTSIGKKPRNRGENMTIHVLGPYLPRLRIGNLRQENMVPKHLKPELSTLA